MVSMESNLEAMHEAGIGGGITLPTVVQPEPHSSRLYQFHIDGREGQ